MKNMIENIFGFLYTLSMGDYLFFFGTFILILSFIYVVFLIKKEESMESIYSSSDVNDLNNIKESIEKEYKPIDIKLNSYEEEQERNAIISYEELISNKDKFKVSYDEDYTNEFKDVNVKKINLDNKGIEDNTQSNLQVKLMNYDKEEAFLVALKQLQKNLSN